MEVFHGVVQRVEYHRLAPHITPLPRPGREKPPLPHVGAQRDRLAVRRLCLRRDSRPERASKAREVHVEAAAGNARVDVHDRCVLVAVFGIPPAGLEVDLIHDLGIEELIQAPRDAGWHRYAVHVVGVLRVLAADVNFSGWRPGGADDGLLQNLGCGVRWRAVVVVLLEDLVAGARVDGQRARGRDLHGRQIHRQRHEPKVRPAESLCGSDRDVVRLRAVAEKPHFDTIIAARKVVNHETAERVGDGRRDDVTGLQDANLSAGQWCAGGTVHHGSTDVAARGEVDRS